jgi:hypothetical protein
MRIEALPTLTPLQLRKIRRIEEEVKKVEKKFLKGIWGKIAKEIGAAYFCTKAPHQAAYGHTHPKLFFQHLLSLKLDPYLPFVDLGSGFGMAVFTASLYFKKAVGFECDPRLHAKAQELRNLLKLKNVELINQNFLKADLSPFRVFYFFKPFYEDFDQLMGEKLKEVEPGSIIISHYYFNRTLFPTKFFTLLEKKRKPVKPIRFFTIVRK